MKKNHKLVVFTSVSSEDIALNVAQELLESQHAACINILPKVHSIYRWKGQICDDRESFLVIKTRSDHFDRVKEIIEALSGYECPEVLSINVESGSNQFLDWIDQCLDIKDTLDEEEMQGNLSKELSDL